MQSPTMQSFGEFFFPDVASTTETVLTSGAPPSSDRVVVQIASARCIRSSPRRVHVGVARCSLEPLGIAGGGNDVSSLRAGAAGGLEADSGAGVSVRATRFSSGIWSARVNRRTLLNRGIAPARAAGIRSASGSLFTGLGAAPRPQRSGRRGRGDLAVDQRTVYRLSSVA